LRHRKRSVSYTTCTPLGCAQPIHGDFSCQRLAAGQTLKPTVSYEPTGKAREGVTWKSSNTAVATVAADGTITAKAVGTADITATATYGGKTAVCTVTVKPAPTAIKLTAPSAAGITMGVSETVQCTTALTPSDAYAILSWSSGDTSVVAVNGSGLLTAKAVSQKDSTGKEIPVTITVKTHNGKSATCALTVKTAPTSVTLNYTAAKIGVGETLDLNATLNSGAGSIVRTYTSSNAAVATAPGSILTGISPGTATITVATYNGKTTACTVTVVPAPTSLSLANASITLAVGESFVLKTTTAALSSHKWATSDSSMATVSPAQGATTTVKAVKAGKSTVTVTDFVGRKKACTVTVVANSVTLASALTVGVGQDSKLTAAPGLT
jgi:uncharacterized protein YjdB